MDRFRLGGKRYWSSPEGVPSLFDRRFVSQYYLGVTRLRRRRRYDRIGLTGRSQPALDEA
jgi:hypothetical protein